MTKYILKRLIVSAITLWIITTVSFFLLRMLPGNPFGSLSAMDPRMQERMIHYYGLDRPLLEQYLSYMSNLFQGNLGYSLKNVGQSVNDIIARTFPYSLQLGLQAYLISFPIGIFLGILAALNRSRALDHSLVAFTALGSAVPGLGRHPGLSAHRTGRGDPAPAHRLRGGQHRRLLRRMGGYHHHGHRGHRCVHSLPGLCDPDLPVDRL